MSHRVLVIAGHPDDEVLGVGGTVAKHVAAGDEVTALIAAAGSLIHDINSEGVAIREAQEAARKLGVHDLKMLDLPDQRLDTLSLVDIITPIEKAVRVLQPQIVYLQWGGDINKDHKLLFEAALVALRPIEECIDTIFAFDTVSSSEWGYPRDFNPDTWVDVSAQLEQKIAALKCYGSEMRPFPHPRSVEAIEAKMKSTGAQVCIPCAEAFMTIRRVKRYDKTPV